MIAFIFGLVLGGLFLWPLGFRFIIRKATNEEQKLDLIRFVSKLIGVSVIEDEDDA